MAVLTFNGNSLQTSSILTSDVQHEDMPDNVAEIFKLHNTAKNVVPYPDQYDPKTITLSGRVISSSATTLDSLLDTFRGYFTGSGKNLDIGYSTGTRRYVIAKINKVKIGRPGGLGYANFSVEMITAGFGMNVTTSSLLTANGRTGSYYSDNLTFPGNAPYQQPVITLTYTAASGSGGNTMNIGNDSNGQLITLVRTFSNGDVIVIDTSNQSVKINGLESQFSGAFPEFPPGAGALSYSDDLTSRTFNISVSANALWL